MFNKHVSIPYSERIVNTDDEFFLEKDYMDDVESVGKDVDFNYGLVNKIKEFWKDMTDTNKEIVWKYLNLLVLLCDKFHKL
jgi:predicted urease superfamily metal-dependent hydrolase